MNKELTPLEALQDIKNTWNCMNPNSSLATEKHFDIVETALKELESIKNKPVAFVVSNRNMENAIIKEISKHKEIKITNLADQKKLRALEIIKEKQVEVCYFMNCETLEEYNDDVIAAYAYEEDAAKPRMLTQKEWDLLKEILK